jgi:hypothetical protein
MQDETRSQRYAIASLVCLILAFGGGPASIMIADQVQSSLLRAICILVGPSTFVLWIVTGVGSLHVLRLRYWQLASTYVALCSTLAAAVALVIAGASQSGGTGAYTMIYVAALLIGANSCWCFWYNWKRTRSIAISISIGVMQLLAAGAIVFLLLARFKDPGDRD